MKLLLGIMLALCGLLACKPHMSLSGISVPVEAKTVSVAYFTNNTSLGAPSLSQRFSEKLRDMVSQQTSLALLSRNGDLQFEGYIESYSVTAVAAQGNDQAGYNRMTIGVKVKFTNKFDPTKNFEQTFTRFNDLPSTQNVATAEPDMVQEIYRQITEDVFLKAFNNW